MKIQKLFFAGLAMLSITSCYNDDDLKNRMSNVEDRVTALETWQKTVNSNISALQTTVTALESKDYVTGVVALSDGTGYEITFQNSGKITIKNGEKGAAGKDAVSPVIGVAQENGVYYWTIDNGDGAGAQFLTDSNGDKIKTTGDKGDKGDTGATGATGATGDKGDKGDAGADAIAPQLRINSTTNMWEISIDGGSTWNTTGVEATGNTGATGATGEKGDQGDAVFAANGVVVGIDKVTFTLADGTTTFEVPLYSALKIAADITDDIIFTKQATDLELTLPTGLKETDYTAIMAEATCVNGTSIAIVTRATAEKWAVSVTKPVYDNGALTEAGKVTLTPPTTVDESNNVVLLKVTLVMTDGSEKASTRTIKYGVPPITAAFNSLTADGETDVTTTTKLTLTFDKAIENLNADDITLTSGTTGATKGTLTDKNDGVYELALSGIKAEGEITVAVAKDNVTFTPASMTVTVYKGTETAYSWYDKTATTLSISTPEALVDLSKIVSGDATALAAIGETSAQNFTGKTITLENDIDLKDVSFSPIGDKDHSFKGTFDGQGNKVSGLNIDITSTEYVYCGFFGRTNNAIIRNLAVSGSVKVTGNSGSIGGIVGDATGGTILNCSFNGDVTGASLAGGIVGYANAANAFVTIQGCYSNATVKSKTAAGGLVGNSYGGTPRRPIINACYSTGSVEGTYAGGLVGNLGDGQLSATVCYTTAAVKGTNAGAAFGQLGGYGATCKNVYFINSTVTEAKGSGTGPVDGDCTSVTATYLQSTGVAAMNSTCATSSLPYTFEVSNDDPQVPLVIVKK